MADACSCANDATLGQLQKLMAYACSDVPPSLLFAPAMPALLCSAPGHQLISPSADYDGPLPWNSDGLGSFTLALRTTLNSSLTPAPTALRFMLAFSCLSQSKLWMAVLPSAKLGVPLQLGLRTASNACQPQSTEVKKTALPGSRDRPKTL